MTSATRKFRISKCAACNHADRARLEMLRVGGASLDALAKKFDLSRYSIHRHFRNHVSAERRAELTAGPAKVEQLAKAAADESRSLLDYLTIARAVLFNQFLNAAEAGDRIGVANVAGRLIESLREIGRLTGELREAGGVSITNNRLNLITSPEFLALQHGLVTIARRHPSARVDIVALLRGLEPATKAAHGFPANNARLIEAGAAFAAT